MNNNKLLEKIKRKMEKGYDDFFRYYCIHIDDWNKIVKEENGITK